ncbi:MAG: FHA domain-containing protein [Pirellulales bacterium]
MRATLQVISSPARARRVELRDGQAARFGRSAWADYSFPEDSRLADIHFAVACFSGGCLLRHLASGQQTFVNRQPVTDVRLRSGDQIVAGQSTWSVTIEGEAIVAPADPAESGAATAAAPEEKPPETDWPALAEYLELDAAVLELLPESRQLEDWLDALAQAGEFRAAARLRAHHLDRRAAVWWGCLCAEFEGIRDRLPPGQQAAWAAARAWVITPTEPARWSAAAAAQKVRHRGVGGQLAMAAFWAGPSLVEERLPPVPPDPRLTGTAITGALDLAAIDQSPKLALQRWPVFLEQGRAVAVGKLPWPSPDANP